MPSMLVNGVSIMAQNEDFDENISSEKEKA
jgi:hypothetical protein